MALEGFMSGAVAGAVGRVVITPLSVLRIRLQVQHGNHLPTWREVTSTLWAQEGWRGLWRGGLTGQLLYASYSGVQFAVFHELKLLRPYASPLANDFVCGAIAGATATTFTFPFDVLRTHMVLSRCPPFHLPQISLPAATRGIYMRDGFVGFFRGLSPSLIIILPSSAISFSVYGFLKRLFPRDLHAWERTACGAVAGMVAQTSVFPLDLAKKRLQAQRLPQLAHVPAFPHYNGLIDCLRRTFMTEGFRGLFRGGAIAIVKQGVSAGVIFTVNDLMRRALNLDKKS